MDVPDKHPNDRLARWISIAGLNNTQLAAQVRALAHQEGHPHVNPDSRRVRAWRQGEHPRPPVPQLLVSVLRQHTGHPLTLDDIGMGSKAHVPLHEREWTHTVLAQELTSLSRGDLVGARFHEPSLQGSVLLNAVRPWVSLQERSATARGTWHLGHTDVDRLHTLTEVLRSLDNLHGGGMARHAVLGQVTRVSNLIAHASYSEAVGRRLFTAVADLAGVAGWMSHDVGEHTAAQRYFLLALRAAKEAANAPIGAHILNCMARQATHLGRPGDALELVHLALYGVRRSATPTVRAVLHSLEARSHAIMGHASEFERAAHQAEAALSAAHPTGEEPAWARFFDSAEYSATIGVCHQILARGSDSDPGYARRSVEMIEYAIDHRPAERHRSLAFDYIGLARALLVQGETERALAVTQQALNLIPDLSSTRVMDRLHELSAEAAIADDTHAAILHETLVRAQRSSQHTGR